MVKFYFVFLLVVINAASGRAGTPPENAPGPGAAGTGGAVTRPAGEDIFAREFILNRSTAALYAVFESTAPEYAAAAYLRRGVYRREFLILFAISRDSKVTFKDLVREREKGVALQTLAERGKLDLMKLFREAAALQAKIEAKTAAAETAAMFAAPDTSSRAVSGAITDADVKLSTSSKN
jgi:hypothetical protein